MGVDSSGIGGMAVIDIGFIANERVTGNCVR